MRRYIALIQIAPDRRVAARLPDFPGLSVVGRTLDEARELLTENLSSHIEKMLLAGEALPEPSQFEALMADSQNQGCAAVLVWAGDAGRAARDKGPGFNPLHAQSNDEWPEADA